MRVDRASLLGVFSNTCRLIRARCGNVRRMPRKAASSKSLIPRAALGEPRIPARPNCAAWVLRQAYRNDKGAQTWYTRVKRQDRPSCCTRVKRQDRRDALRRSNDPLAHEPTLRPNPGFGLDQVTQSVRDVGELRVLLFLYQRRARLPRDLFQILDELLALGVDEGPHFARARLQQGVHGRHAVLHAGV